MEIVEGQEVWKANREKTEDSPIVSTDDMVWAEGFFFSAPTRYGVVASQLRAFIDAFGPIWSEGKLADRTLTATTSAQNAHGGQETTCLSLYTTAMYWRNVLVPPGYTDPAVYEAGGNPYSRRPRAIVRRE